MTVVNFMARRITAVDAPEWDMFYSTLVILKNTKIENKLYMSLTVAAIQALGIHLISANNLNVPLREQVFAHISK